MPVFFAGPGAHGSDWWTTVFVANAGQDAIRFTRHILSGEPDCAAVCGCGPTTELRAREVKELCVAYGAHPFGLLLYMEKNQPDAHFGARIADRSRSVDTAGTELKIVREHELRRINIILPYIPISPGYRVGLRIFDTFPQPHPEVLLVIHDQGGLDAPLVEEIIPLNLPPDAGDPQPAHPAFAMIGDLAARYPQLKGHGLVTIELLLPELDISPVPAPSYWAMATITNNVTQQVTMVTPQ